MRNPFSDAGTVQDQPEALRTARVLTRRRILPLAALLYAIAYLDRVNVGFVAVSMSADLRLDALAFGLGAGMFFLGYVLFEIPSIVIFQRIGARLWIARIMITWGLI